MYGVFGGEGLGIYALPKGPHACGSLNVRFLFFRMHGHPSNPSFPSNDAGFDASQSTYACSPYMSCGPSVAVIPFDLICSIRER